MKLILNILLISIFLSENLFAIESNILKDVVKNIIVQKTYIDFYYDYISVLFKRDVSLSSHRHEVLPSTESYILKTIVKDIIAQETYINFYYDGTYHDGSTVFRIAPLSKHNILLSPYRQGVLLSDKYKNSFAELENVILEEIDDAEIRGLNFFLLYIKNAKNNEELYVIEIVEGEAIRINDIRYKFNKVFMDIIWQIFPEIYIEQKVIGDVNGKFHNRRLF
jgi:hypothetical protein